MNYKQTTGYNDFHWSASAEDIVSDFVHYAQGWETVPGVEKQIARLADLVGRIADAAGLDLTTIISRGELTRIYSVDDSESNTD